MFPFIETALAFLPGIADAVGANQDRKAQEGIANANRDAQERINAENLAMQKEFARQGIRWRVEDAVAAGLHPLAALGAQGASYSPAHHIDGGGDPGPGDSYRAIGRMGQDISRSVLAMATPEERKFKQLQLQKLQTENEILNTELTERRNRLANSGSAGLPSNAELPALAGQGNSYIQEQPLRSTHRQPGAPHQDVGHIADMAFTRTASGGLAVVPSKDVKERIEDQLIPELAWAARNYGMPNIGMAPSPDPRYYPLPKGYTHWRWNPLYQEYRPGKSGRKWWQQPYRPWKKSWWTYEEE